jgi:glyoxylase-like metal-dependent hydrolase (beta-lactamase superfamily II)
MKDISFLKAFLLIFVVTFIGGCKNTTTNKVDITDHFYVIQGDVNGAVITSGAHNLVIYGDPENSIQQADLVLFTHARRDVVWAGRNLVAGGAKAVVPAGEAGYFSNPDSVWAGIAKSQFHDYRQKQSCMPVKSIPVYRMVSGGDTLLWNNIQIKVIDSRGYTEGAVSYLVHIDGIDVAFVGDLIYGDGKLMDIYSLQDEIPELDIWGYHGYAARMADLIKSLEKIAGLNPGILVPARGAVIHNPGVAIGNLIKRLRLVYKNYLSINAFRWYKSMGWGNPDDGSINLASRVLPSDMVVDWMPFAEIRKNPKWLKHNVNSKLIISDDGTGFLIDGGMENAFEKFMNLEANFPCSDIEGIFITHYHDDHTNYINKLREKYNCPAYITKELKDILNHPQAYKLPAMTSEKIDDLTVVEEGGKIDWKEFTFTFYYFPGQTIYHDAILVKNNRTGENIFLTGDSFTPAGIDDYCSQNRNLLGESLGYIYCVDILNQLPDSCWLVNQHIEQNFRFTKEELGFIKTNLTERQMLLQDLFPWDDINYGIDGQWARFYPYSQEVNPGQNSTEFSVVLYNHSATEQEFTIRPEVGELACIPEKQTILVSPGEEVKAVFKLNIPKRLAAGNRVITADIAFGKTNLHKWCESIIKIKR